MNAKPIRIYFWKRRPTSVEQTDVLVFTRLDSKTFEADINGKETAVSKKEFDELYQRLMKECGMENVAPEYQAFLYEDDKSNFTLKFFLEIDLDNHTYVAEKGLMPFKQPYYKEIIETFSKFFEN